MYKWVALPYQDLKSSRKKKKLWMPLCITRNLNTSWNYLNNWLFVLAGPVNLAKEQAMRCTFPKSPIFHHRIYRYQVSVPNCTCLQSQKDYTNLTWIRGVVGKCHGIYFWTFSVILFVFPCFSCFFFVSFFLGVLFFASCFLCFPSIDCLIGFSLCVPPSVSPVIY